MSTDLRSLSDVDRLIHEPSRSVILAILAAWRAPTSSTSSVRLV